MEQWADKFVEWFGPAGGYAVFLSIAGAIVAGRVIHKLFHALLKANQALAAKDVACAQEIATIEAQAAAEKTEYKASIDAQLKDALETYRARDDQKRADNIALFAKYDTLLDRVLTRVEAMQTAMTNLAFEVSRKH